MSFKFDKRLVILLLLYTFLALALDCTYPIPKREWLARVMVLGHWVCAFLLMFLLALALVPEAFVEFRDQCQLLCRPLVVCAALLTALMLAINVRVGGDIRSPYTSFLSSFPIISMVLLFETVSLKSCLKGAAIVAGSLAIVYLADYFLLCGVGHGIAVADETLADFSASATSARLAIIILLVTATSNLLSIYFGALKQPSAQAVLQPLRAGGSPTGP